LHKLFGILADDLLLPVDTEQVGQADAMRVRHGSEPALLPAERIRGIPVRFDGRRGWQQAFKPIQQRVSLFKQVISG